MSPTPRGFPRSARLLKRSSFENVYKNGRRHFGTHMTVFYRLDPSVAGARVGLTVGRVLGTAVVRNRIKRRMRDVVRHELETLTQTLAGTGIEIVINPKKSAATIEIQALRNELAKAFQAIGAKAGKGESDKR